MPMDISMFVHPVETMNVLKSLRRRITQVESQIHLEAEAGKVRDPVLETARQDIEDLRDKLQQGTERFFKFGLYITIYGNSKDEVEKSAQFIESLLESRLVYVKEAVFRLRTGVFLHSAAGQRRTGRGQQHEQLPLSPPLFLLSLRIFLLRSRRSLRHQPPQQQPGPFRPL